MRAILMALILCPALAAQSPVAQAQRAAVLLAQIWDDAIDAPLAGVLVSVAGAENDMASDAHGYFSVTFGGGRIALTMRKLGYKPLTQLVTVAAGDTERVTFFLERSAQMLDTVSVRERGVEPASTSSFLEGFERRRKTNNGAQFITRDYIERRGSVSTLDMFRTLPGVRVIDSSGVALVASGRSKKVVMKGRVSDLAPCVMQLAVDGFMKEWGYPINDISPKEIHGIEIYNGPASIPREFMSSNRDTYCGLILIWTRRDR